MKDYICMMLVLCGVMMTTACGPADDTNLSDLNGRQRRNLCSGATSEEVECNPSSTAVTVGEEDCIERLEQMEGDEDCEATVSDYEQINDDPCVEEKETEEAIMRFVMCGR